MFSALCRVRIFILSLFFVAFIRVPAQAAVIDKVVEDFKPLSGYVVMESDGEYLIDLDMSKGVSIGDLFSILKPGKKIVHPVSGEILGTLQEEKGVLKVTRLQKGYSYARPLGRVREIKRGDPIRRYEKIPALFWDYTGSGEPFFIQLRNKLPDLKWQDYAAAQAVRPEIPAASKIESPTLLFIIKKEGLEVRDSEFQVIHSYGPSGLFATSVKSTSIVPYAVAQSTEKPKGKAGYMVSYPGFKDVSTLAGVTVMADFMRDGERLLMATTDGSRIRVQGVNKDVSPITESAFSGGGQALSVQWWRPSRETFPYLAVTILNDEKVEAKIFAFRENRLVPLRVWLPYFLGAFDLDGDGIPETLLRQSFDPDLFWGRQIRRLNLVQGKLEASKLDFKIPGIFTVLGSLFADVTGDGKLESIFVRGKNLYVYAGRKRLYKSPSGIGGSLSVATYEVNPGAKDILINSAMVEVSPTASDLDGDGRPELVVIASDSSYVTASGIAPVIKNSRLAVIKYRNGMFVKGTLGEVVGKPIQGLTVANGQLLFVASESGSFFAKGANSHLLAYSLAR